MALRSIESRLPPGFRFHPNDEELVFYYLSKKVSNEMISGVTLVDVNLHDTDPWELPDEARLSANEWYFFSFRDRRYASGSRANRSTKTGYWKATGKDRPIQEPSSGELSGLRKTLVYYGGRAPSGNKTGWVMHEFRLNSSGIDSKGEWVLCRVFNKEKEETAREDSDGLSFLDPSTSLGTNDWYSSGLALCSSGFVDFSPEMTPPPRIDGEFDFFDVKDFMNWGNPP